MSRVLIVFGMHRSGTSITTRWLNACGLDVGQSLLGPQNSNKRGHYEDMDFYEFHESVFRDLNIPFGGFEELDKVQLNDEHRIMMLEIVGEKSRQSKQWAWKDPRTCLFIDEYLKVIPNACLLVLSRDYNEIINSLINREIGHIKEDIIRDAKWGRLSFLSYELKEGRAEKRRLGELFARACIHYYKIILETTEKHPADRWFGIKLGELPEMQDRVLQFLGEAGFELEKKDFRQYYETSLMSANTNCPFIPSHLKRELDELQTELNARCSH